MGSHSSLAHNNLLILHTTPAQPDEAEHDILHLELPVALVIPEEVEAHNLQLELLLSLLSPEEAKSHILHQELSAFLLSLATELLQLLTFDGDKCTSRQLRLRLRGLQDHQEL